MVTNIKNGFQIITPREIRVATEEGIANRSQFFGKTASSYAKPTMIHTSALSLMYMANVAAMASFPYLAVIAVASYSTAYTTANTKFGKGLTLCTEATLDKTVSAGAALFQSGRIYSSSESEYRPIMFNVMRLSVF